MLTLILFAVCVLLLVSCVGAGVLTAKERAIARTWNDGPREPARIRRRRVARRFPDG